MERRMEEIVNKKPSLESYIKKAGAFLISVAILAAVIPAALYIAYFSWAPSDSHERWGQFGDFLGGTLGPIFGFISLLAILITLFLQAKELSHSTEALQDQGESLRIQAFENTFFSLVRLSHEATSNLIIEEGDDFFFKGVSVFRKLRERLSQSYSFTQKKTTSTDELEVLRISYDRFYSHNKQHIDHYLRNISQVIEFVKIRCPSDHKQYVDILLAQLSAYEHLLVFYHSICRPGYIDKEFLSQHGFFDELADSLLLKELHTDLK